MVNYEANLFSVWQANTAVKASDVVALDNENNMVSEICAGKTNDSSVDPGDAPSGVPTPSEEAQPPKRLSGRAIGGIVVGAVTAIGALALVAFCFYRHRNKTHAEALIQEEPELKMPGNFVPNYTDRHSAIHSKTPLELPADRQHIVELGG